MKNFIALLAVLGFTTGATAADIEHTGSFRLIYTDVDNQPPFSKDIPDSDSEFDQRTRLNLSTKVGENMSASVGLVHNTAWGTNNDQQPDAGGTDDTLTVNEAFMSWMINDEMALKVGRSGADIANGKVVSRNDWNPVHYAFDGGVLAYDHEMAKFSLFGVRAVDGDASGVSTIESDAAYWGLNADFKGLGDMFNMANFHYMIVKVDPNALVSGSTKEDSNRIGLALAGDTAGFNYGLTYAMVDGEWETSTAASGDITSDMMEVEVGYSMPDMMNMHIGFLYHTDSGDKDGNGGSTANGNDRETYDAFYYDEFNNAGEMNFVGFGNLTFMQLMFGLDVSEDLRLDVDYYMFEQTEKAGAIYGSTGYIASLDGVGTGSAAVAGDTGKDDIGTELDISLTKTYTSNFYIKGAYRMFDAGKAYGATLDDSATQLYLEANMTF